MKLLVVCDAHEKPDRATPLPKYFEIVYAHSAREAFESLRLTKFEGVALTYRIPPFPGEVKLPKNPINTGSDPLKEYLRIMEIAHIRDCNISDAINKLMQEIVPF